MTRFFFVFVFVCSFVVVFFFFLRVRNRRCCDYFTPLELSDLTSRTWPRCLNWRAFCWEAQFTSGCDCSTDHVTGGAVLLWSSVAGVFQSVGRTQGSLLKGGRTAYQLTSALSLDFGSGGSAVVQMTGTYLSLRLWHWNWRTVAWYGSLEIVLTLRMCGVKVFTEQILL